MQLDALEFIHENEYVHGNLTAENVFVNPKDLSQVTLMGYGFTFRYCPGGKHVTYKEGSRSPHEGDLEFISVDIHKGCGEGDLEFTSVDIHKGCSEGNLEFTSVDINKGCGEGLNTMTHSSSWAAPCIFSPRQETPEIKGQERCRDRDREYKQYPGHYHDHPPACTSASIRRVSEQGWCPYCTSQEGKLLLLRLAHSCLSRPSRRSDLQTLGYCMLKWLYGSLPWTSCLPNTEEITRQKQK
ncbi:hypothetical protein U0070_023104 [Myodes glareolus]|uniref:Protein kinase domain-containing protein n=1 Tax=Myodes glareolus TaxID=447135 RepID=A0AAW0HTQ1_MYOGA